MKVARKFTFICGGDDYFVSRLGKSILAEKSRDLESEFSQEIVAGAANTVEEVEIAVTQLRQALQTLPLFGGKKVIWFKEVNFLADSITGRAEGTRIQLENLQHTLEQINPENVDLVITAFPVDRRRSFLRWCEKNSDFHMTGGGRGADSAIIPLIEEECGRLEVGFEEGAQDYLVEKLGGNARLIVEELRKLSSYLGEEGNVIRKIHITELVPEYGEGKFFEAVEAFYSADIERALEAVRRHFFGNRDARGLIASLQGRNRLLIQLRALMGGGEIPMRGRQLSPSSLEKAANIYQEHFGESREKRNFNLFSQSPWYLRHLCADADRFSLKNLIRFQSAFVCAFEEILDRAGEQEETMRNLVVRCLSRDSSYSKERYEKD